MGLIYLCPTSPQSHCYPQGLAKTGRKLGKLNIRIKGSIARRLTWLRRISVQLSKKPLSKLKGWKPAIYLSQDLPSGALGKYLLVSPIVALAQHSPAHHTVMEEVSSTDEDRVGQDGHKIS